MANAIVQMVKPIINPVRTGYLNARQSITGAPVSLINFGSSSIRSWTMPLFTPTDFRKENYDQRADQLRENCFISLPDFYDPQLIRETHEQFTKAISNEDLITNNGCSRSLKANVNFEKHIPSIYKLLRNEELKRIIHSYYGSCFNLTTITGTRLYPVPEKDRTPANLLSAIWHCDDIPTDVLHLAVYLHDVTPAHGPTKLVSRKRTKELMCMGYGRRWEIGIPQSVLEDKNHVKDFSSKAGTAHLMLPCLSLHRAGIPEDGLIRDSLFFSFRPGLEPKQISQLSPMKKKMYGVLQELGENHLYGSKTFEKKSVIYS